MGRSLKQGPFLGVPFYKGAVLYLGTPIRDPSLENCPYRVGC